MIITERYPQDSLYALGAELLKILKDKNSKYTLFELYNIFIKIHSIELKQFILTLDWLFLINTVNITDDGFISICF
jgi:hypothetical protein